MLQSCSPDIHKCIENWETNKKKKQMWREIIVIDSTHIRNPPSPCVPNFNEKQTQYKKSSVGSFEFAREMLQTTLYIHITWTHEHTNTLHSTPHTHRTHTFTQTITKRPVTGWRAFIACCHRFGPNTVDAYMWDSSKNPRKIERKLPLFIWEPSINTRGMRKMERRTSNNINYEQ